MNMIVLKGFISHLNFIAKRKINPYSSNIEINISNIDNKEHKINGNVIIKNETNQNETIIFNIQLSESADMLVFKSTYQSDKETLTNRDLEEVNTFVIVNPETKSFFTPKTKYLIHLVDGNLKQAYIVNKKYKFTNGISENYSKLNMDNKDNIDNINNIYTSHKSR